MTPEEIEARIVAVRCAKWCDGGYRGMDACNTCEMTGSQLLVKPTLERFPNTKEGHDAAVAFLTA